MFLHRGVARPAKQTKELTWALYSANVLRTPAKKVKGQASPTRSPRAADSRAPIVPVEAISSEVLSDSGSRDVAVVANADAPPAPGASRSEGEIECVQKSPPQQVAAASKSPPINEPSPPAEKPPTWMQPSNDEPPKESDESPRPVTAGSNQVRAAHRPRRPAGGVSASPRARSAGTHCQNRSANALVKQTDSPKYRTIKHGCGIVPAAGTDGSYFTAAVRSDPDAEADPAELAEARRRKKERAFALADRYRDAMQRLTSTQADWRRRHDEWMKKRELECISSPVPQPSAPAPEHRPSQLRKSYRSSTTDMPDVIRGLTRTSQASRASMSSPKRSSLLDNPGVFEGNTMIDYAMKFRNSRSSLQSGDALDGLFASSGTGGSTTSRAGPGHQPREGGNGMTSPPGEEQNLSSELSLPSGAEKDKSDDANPEKSSTPVFSQSHFDLMVHLSRKFGMTVQEVSATFKEFDKLDCDKGGTLDRSEFLSKLREILKLPPGATIPKHLLSKEWIEADTDGNGSIDFEEYLAWSQGVAFTQELHCDSKLDWTIRDLAKRYGLPLPDVETILKAFDRFDEDHSGEIDKPEFKGVLMQLLKVKNQDDLPPERIERYWKEVDTDHSGTIEFEEFLQWYVKYFYVPDDGYGCYVDPATQAYASLGTNRFSVCHVQRD